MKKALIMAAALLSSAVVFAQNKNYRVAEPTKDNKVVLVGRFVLDEDFDTQYLMRAFALKNPNPVLCYFTPAGSYLGSVIDNGSAGNRNENGAFFAMCTTVSKEGTVQFDTQTIYINATEKKLNSVSPKIVLPIGRRIKVESGDKFVYIGSYFYKVDNRYTLCDRQIKDEYEDARDFIHNLFPDAELVRATFIDR